MNIEYKDMTILEIQNLKKENKLSYFELTNYYLNRIEKLNKYTNSISEVNKNAIELAMKRDDEYHEGVDLLYGIPVLIKDNINTVGMKTTAGAVVLKDFYSNDDAFIIKQLKKAGAIILGKTNLSEFANFISGESKNGYSALKGQVVNPYGDDLDVCGSSAGTGASITTSLAQAGIGTETSGSILCPSVNNSLVGLKPSVGYVSREGIIPISPTQDVPGPMARTVIDTAILFNGIIGIDKKDESTVYDSKIDLKEIQKPISGMKLGYVKSSLITGASSEEIDMIDKQVDILKSLGAEIVDFYLKKPSREVNANVLFYEFPKALKKYFENEPNAPVKTLDEIVEFNKKDPEKRIPFGQSIFEKCFEINKLGKYEEELQFDKSFVSDYAKQIEEMELDALIYIGHYGTWVPAKGGFPSITVPIGYIENRPLGITFSSLKFQEQKLLQIGYNFEKSTRCRIDPIL